MTINFDKIQNNVRTLGTLTDNTSFLEGFLSAFNFPKATFDRLPTESLQGVNRGVYVQRKIYFLSTTASNPYSEFNILKKNDLSKVNADFIIIANDTDLVTYERTSGEMLETSKADLYQHIEFFFSLLGITPGSTGNEMKSADMKAAEKFAQLYNELLIHNPGRESDIGELICRLLLCCFADSIGVLTNGGFKVLVAQYTETSGSDLGDFLNNLFAAMKTENRDQLPGYFVKVNFIDRRLFATDVNALVYKRNARSLIADLFCLDWSEISPEILGGLIQSIVRSNNENSNGNYTSTANVHKVIGPLFMDDLHHEYEKAKTSLKECAALLNRVRAISVFDPSCGAGNFLLVAHKELVKLAKRISETIDYFAAVSEPRHQTGALKVAENALIYAPLSIIPVTNFYGIDDDRFSCAIARLGFLFVVCQELRDSGDINAVFKSAISVLFSDNIVTGNATRVDWDIVCQGRGETYLIGNPSYVGARKQTAAQKADLARVFSGYTKISNLDYAACWFMLATKYVCVHGGGFAFVTTNSLTQGEQVQLLWPKLFAKGVHIRFAYTSFKWRNDARNRTAVTVVVIGVVPNINQQPRELFTSTAVFEPRSISPYLTAGDTIIKARHSPLSNFPTMVKGNMPLYWSDYLLTHEAMTDLVSRDPRARKFLKKVVGADEFINGIERWCFWIHDDDLDEAKSIPYIADKIELVRQKRLASTDASARRHAAHPHKFRESRETTKSSLVVPSVSSENRLYIPIGFIDKSIIVTNLAFVVYDCDPWIFGVVSSKMHNLWVRTVCGALETRIRYSSQLGYNTFPFPDISVEQKAEITKRVFAIVASRERYTGMTYADWYNPDNMPDELRYAHYLLDAVIDRCYQSEEFVSDHDRLDRLFEHYNTLGG